jgi:hypothetical protein
MSPFPSVARRPPQGGPWLCVTTSRWFCLYRELPQPNTVAALFPLHSRLGTVAFLHEVSDGDGSCLGLRVAVRPAAGRASGRLRQPLASEVVVELLAVVDVLLRLRGRRKLPVGLDRGYRRSVVLHCVGFLGQFRVGPTDGLQRAREGGVRIWMWLRTTPGTGTWLRSPDRRSTSGGCRAPSSRPGRLGRARAHSPPALPSFNVATTPPAIQVKATDGGSRGGGRARRGAVQG